MSDKPIIADNVPHPIQLEKGKEYYFCTCGRSNNQPFCDGAHVGTSFSPQAFIADKEGEAWLCYCKQTKNPPFCDGSHKPLQSDQIGKEAPE